MFDNLRQSGSTGFDDLPDRSPRRVSTGRVMGMTPVQLFLLSLMLFLNVSLLGCFALIVFDKVRLPFF